MIKSFVFKKVKVVQIEIKVSGGREIYSLKPEEENSWYENEYKRTKKQEVEDLKFSRESIDLNI